MTEIKEKENNRCRLPLMIAWIGLCAMFLMGDGRASIISDIPNKLNDALLDGTSLYAAKAILTASIMMSAGLVLAMAKHPSVMLILIVLMSILGALTAIGWADLTFLILAALACMAMFGSKIAGWMTSPSG